jgi:phosphoribosylglycinamide formyltransferase-1
MVGKMHFKVGFFVSGKGRLAMAAIENSAYIGIHPCVVIADHNADGDLERFSANHGVPFVRIPKLPRSEFDQVLYEYCTKESFDLVCLTFDKIVPPDLVALYRGRMINVHPGLLPAFDGMGALERAEFRGVRFAGATIHEVVEEVDAGPIIAQCVTGLDFKEKSDEFGARLYGDLRKMFLQTLNWYATGRVFKDEIGRIWIKDAKYGGFPISPSVELNFDGL